MSPMGAAKAALWLAVARPRQWRAGRRRPGLPRTPVSSLQLLVAPTAPSGLPPRARPRRIRPPGRPPCSSVPTGSRGRSGRGCPAGSCPAPRAPAPGAVGPVLPAEDARALDAACVPRDRSCAEHTLLAPETEQLQAVIESPAREHVEAPVGREQVVRLRPPGVRNAAGQAADVTINATGQQTTGKVASITPTAATAISTVHPFLSLKANQ